MTSFKECFIEKESLAIIMEFAGGGDLAHIIQNCKKHRLRVPEEDIKRYFFQLLSALRTLHRFNIIHRDLKSANIFVCEKRQQVKLGDMNVSKILKQDFASTQTGTPYYASPEVWRDEDYNAKADIWSLGCVIFELCNLKQPFQASGLDRLYKKVQGKHIERFDGFYSEELQEMVHKCLTLDYLKRPGARELMTADLFNEFRSPGKKETRPREEGHVKTKVKYNGQQGVRNEQDTMRASRDGDSEDGLIVLNKKGRLKRWGRLVSDKESSLDFGESILGTIPVDMDFKALAEKLPKPRYSYSGDKKASVKVFENPKRSKSGVRISDHDNREKLRKLRERRLKLMSEVGVSRKRAKKREGESLKSAKIKKSRESLSQKSGLSKKQARKKSLLIDCDGPLAKPSIKKKYLKDKREPIGRSLLREKEKQDKILSKIEMCHSQLVRQEAPSKAPRSKESRTTKSKTRHEETPIQVPQDPEVQPKEVSKQLFRKTRGEGSIKYTRESQKGRVSKAIPLISQFELNNSYNLLRPIEQKSSQIACKMDEYQEDPQIKRKPQKNAEKTPTASSRIKTSQDRNPRRIIVDKITYTFSKKNNPSKQEIANQRRPSKKAREYKSNVTRVSEEGGHVRSQIRRPEVLDLKSSAKGLPRMKEGGSIPEISLDKGKVVLRQRRDTRSQTDKFLKLMQENLGAGLANRHKKGAHSRRRSEDPLKLLKLKGSYKTQNSSENIGYEEVAFGSKPSTKKLRKIN